MRGLIAEVVLGYSGKYNDPFSLGAWEDTFGSFPLGPAVSSSFPLIMIPSAAINVIKG